ncbi:unnamed protein product [Polarella glacialis]|uniref:Transaldolase n=1 Tax=Polarella glacialis TaxID=89957 RepID=A0A813JC15_POLGL|nr:unnamed protein product [Polarella glacialis]CAE8718459.1 unnamed protein product [Polarella glacialis]
MLLSVSSPRWREGRNGVTAGLPSVARSQKRSPVKGVGNVLSFCIFFLSCCFCITVPAFNFGFGRSRPTVAAASRVADDSGKGPRLFLDTGDIAEWERCLPLGIFCGLTTNPVLLERAGVPCTLPHIKGLLGRALDFHGTEEVMFQAWGEDVEGLVSTGRSLRDLDPLRVVVKLPLTVAGVKAAAELRRSGEETRVCMTACYSSKQGLVAAGLGAEYIAPYLGRMSDLAAADGKQGSGLKECALLQQAISGLGAKTRVLVASIRSADQMTELAAQGCDTFTFSPRICDELFSVDATVAAAAEFERAARALQDRS